MNPEVAAIGTRIQGLREEKERLNDEEDALWKRFFEICDDLVGDGENFKQILPDIGFTIAREMHTVTPSLNILALQTELTPDQWKAISTQTRVFDMNKLEAQVSKKAIDPELVNEHTEFKPPVPHKKLRRATKKELKEANE